MFLTAGQANRRQPEVGSSRGSKTSATVPSAQAASIAIDEEIRNDAAIRKADGRRQVKVVILGQAESGKSTLRKQLQLYHESHTLDGERPAWRIVVYANLVKAVRTILDELEYECARHEEPPLSAAAPPRSRSTGPSEFEALVDAGSENEILALRRSLLPLVSLEVELSDALSDEIVFVPRRSVLGFDVGRGLGFRSAARLGTRPIHLATAALVRVATARAAEILGSSAQVVDALWRHRAVQALVAARKVRLEESGEFFLNEVHRVGHLEYVPSIDDILHARLPTIGVVERSMEVTTTGGAYVWNIYDVGGVRSQRPAWASFFDDANALIFLAPISAFDQYLEEDPLTNRISDSVQLLTSIAANALLKNAQLILLLNKTDILRRKLEAGVKIRDYITSYGERKNDFSTAAEYFRSHFLAAHKKNSGKRPLFIHFTCMVDIRATQSVFASVEDIVLRRHVSQAKLV
ncbi:hypothetical protein MKEN_00298900 [Mycena kentingensis (nom. inval.)]|nr:hypothetical protein MKEN_00298900 [Mycena kentingensis (nom. inval.)]